MSSGDEMDDGDHVVSLAIITFGIFYYGARYSPTVGPSVQRCVKLGESS